MKKIDAVGKNGKCCNGTASSSSLRFLSRRALIKISPLCVPAVCGVCLGVWPGRGGGRAGTSAN